MLTNFHLTPELESAIQIRAAREGRAVQDIVVELLTSGLGKSPAIVPLQPLHSSQQPGTPGEKPVAKTLPLIKVRSNPIEAPPAVTAQDWCERLKDIELQLEIERYEAAFGHQHVDRSDS